MGSNARQTHCYYVRASKTGTGVYRPGRRNGLCTSSPPKTLIYASIIAVFSVRSFRAGEIRGIKPLSASSTVSRNNGRPRTRRLYLYSRKNKVKLRGNDWLLQIPSAERRRRLRHQNKPNWCSVWRRAGVHWSSTTKVYKLHSNTCSGGRG